MGRVAQFCDEEKGGRGVTQFLFVWKEGGGEVTQFSGMEIGGRGTGGHAVYYNSYLHFTKLPISLSIILVSPLPGEEYNRTCPKDHLHEETALSDPVV